MCVCLLGGFSESNSPSTGPERGALSERSWKCNACVFTAGSFHTDPGEERAEVDTSEKETVSGQLLSS